jgi:hypothetical protein
MMLLLLLQAVVILVGKLSLSRNKAFPMVEKKYLSLLSQVAQASVKYEDKWRS